MQQIDIQAIKNKASKKHTEFIQELGSHSDRVLAEHNLIMELTFTRINFICDAFIDMGVINTKGANEENTAARKIFLSQAGYDNYVCISTNGDKVVIDGDSYLTILSSGLTDRREIMSGANGNDFDWELFSDKHLDMIHSVIYERKEALETKVFGVDTQ